MDRRPWSLGLITATVALLAGCRADHGVRSPLAVSDFRLGAIEQRVGRLDAGIDEAMLSVDAEAFKRPAAAPFREAVTIFFHATHPMCLTWSREGTEREQDFIAEAKAPLRDFDRLVARLELTPLRRDLDLAWERAALSSRKMGRSLDCGPNAQTEREIMRNATARMRDALDRMEAAMTASAS